MPGITIAFGAPTLSRFSKTRSFTTALGGAQWSPLTAPSGIAPSPGATNVSIKPAFQWNAADWATGYEFVLARDSGFVDVVIVMTGDKALPITAWADDRNLDYDTTYFWKVRAISPTSHSEWAVSVFTTETAPPSLPLPQPPPPSPVPLPSSPFKLMYIWAIIGIGVALIISLLVVIVRTSR